MTGPALLRVDGLGVRFTPRGLRRTSFTAVDDVSFDIRPGETLGLVGESGSGKSTIGRAILGLVPPTTGTVTYAGEDITHASRRRRRALSRDLQVIFQDPYSSLNPAMAVGDILSEPLAAQGVSRTAANVRVRELLDAVHLPSDTARRLPREFSGGQRQRIAIARALALDPRLIVCDEPVSALDLTTQAIVIDLLIEIQERTGVSFLFISHDLAVIRCISHRVAVLRHGDLVEIGDVAQVTEAPRHDYTRSLLLASPVPDPVAQRARRKERLVQLGRVS